MNVLLLIYVGVAYFLIKYFVSHDRGAKEPSRALWQAGIYGVLAIILASIIEAIFISDVALLQSGTDSPGFEFSALIVLGLKIGLIEEGVKIIPLALRIYKKPYFNEVTDGIIYFGIVGLTFGLLENVSYALAFGQGAGYLRVIVAPFLHVGFAVIAGMSIAWSKIAKKSPIYILLGFAASVGLHAIYDIGVFSRDIKYILAALLLSLILNIGVFVLYRRAQLIDEKLGLSTVGTNRFCRNCGRQNIHGTLFCEFCGYKT